MGLGLAIARHILDLHGGNVVAQSEGQGRGAVFTVSLPALAERVPVAIAMEPAAEHASPLEGRLAGIHALAVDDDVNALAMLTSMLELGGATVTPAASVDEAIERFAAARDVAIVLSDIGMPKRDGYDLIATLRHQFPRPTARLAAIAISGYAREEDHARALRAGFDAHLAKPFAMNALYDLILRLVGARRARDDRAPDHATRA